MNKARAYPTEFAYQLLEGQSAGGVWFHYFQEKLNAWDLAGAQILITDARRFLSNGNLAPWIHYGYGILFTFLGEFARAERSLLMAENGIGSLPEITTAERCELLADLGRLYRLQSNHEAAIACHKKQLAAHKTIGDRSGTAEALHHLGFDFYEKGEVNTSEQYFRKAISLLIALGDSDSLAYSYNALGLVLLSQEKWDEAAAAFSQALKTFEKNSNQYSKAQVLGNLGNLASLQGDQATANKYYLLALEIFNKLNVAFDKIGILNNLGGIAVAKKDFASAQRYYEESTALSQQLGDRKGERDAMVNLGLVARLQSKWASAGTYYAQAWRLTRQIRDRGMLWELLVRRTRLVFLAKFDRIARLLKCS